MRQLAIFTFCIFLVSLAGCGPQTQEFERLCPGPINIDELMEEVSHSPLLPFRADGTSQLIYADEKGRKSKERVDVKIWINPPFDIYLQGDIAFDPKGLILGSNKEEFWLALRPDKIDSFYSGRWDQAGGGFVSASAGILLEALGVVNFESADEWEMAASEKFTVLAKLAKDGTIIKSVTIDNCNRSVRKIDYFDSKGELTALAEMDDYRQVGDNLIVPRLIKIINKAGAKFELNIKLGNIKETRFNEQQEKKMFNPPNSSDYENVYRIMGDKLVELKK
ncbi:MAG: hypothetical protein PHF37_06085 [Phycisphaerae bacterium]|nr:hypothetical protein [Phycisphaerae bacterium]